jgi:hypothetical protein
MAGRVFRLASSVLMDCPSDGVAIDKTKNRAESVAQRIKAPSQRWTTPHMIYSQILFFHFPVEPAAG